MFISHSSRKWEDQEQKAADLVPGESLLLDLQTAVFWFYFHMAEGSKRARKLSYKGTSPIYEGSTIMT